MAQLTQGMQALGIEDIKAGITPQEETKGLDKVNLAEVSDERLETPAALTFSSILNMSRLSSSCITGGRATATFVTPFSSKGSIRLRFR